MPVDRDQGCGPIKSFLGHLEDLRRVLVWSLAAVVGGMIIASQFAPSMLAILKYPLRTIGRDPETFLRTMTVTGAMNVAILIVFWGGLLISLPVVTVIVGKYIMAALSSRERNAVYLWSGMAVLMFLAGVAIAYFAVMPPALKVMLWFNEWLGVTVEFVTVNDYIAFCLIMMVVFGVMFEIPVVLLFLGHLGIVTSAQLRSARRFVIVGLLILAMVLTPTTDPFTQLVLAVPLTVLYEFCAWIIRLRERRTKHD